MAGKQRPQWESESVKKTKERRNRPSWKRRARRKAEGGLVADDIVDVSSLIPDPDVYGQETVDVPEDEEEEEK